MTKQIRSAFSTVMIHGGFYAGRNRACNRLRQTKTLEALII